MRTTTAIVAALAAFAATGAAAQTLYKCVQDGKTVYQAEPCAKSAAQGTVKPPPAPAAAVKPSPGGATPAGAPSAEIERTIEFMSTYRACADGVQVWGQEMAGPYEQWRTRNTAVVSRIENDRQLQDLYRQRLAAKRNGKAGMCRDVALELRGKK